jgi:hypothetical protein
MATTTRRRGAAIRLALAFLVSFGLFVIATSSPRLSPPRSDVVSQPPSKKPVPQILTDGTPVVVVSKSGSPPVVIEAIDTHVPFGVAGLVRWCEASDTYVSTFYARWDRFGVKKGGPAVSGLATFDVAPIAGTERFRVGARVPGVPIGTRAIQQTAQYCEPEDTNAIMRLSDEPWADTPADVHVNSWETVFAKIVTAPDLSRRLCPKTTAGKPPPCRGGLNTPNVTEPRVRWTNYAHWFLVHRRGNVIDRVVAIESDER